MIEIVEYRLLEITCCGLNKIHIVKTIEFKYFCFLQLNIYIY